MKFNEKADDERAPFIALLHDDFSTFVEWAFFVLGGNGASYLPNWHVQAMAHHLALCLQGKIRRLLITVPPRYLKSHCASVCLPAFILGRNPAAKIMCVSYSEKPATEFAVGTRNLMRSSDYQFAFPKTVLSDGPIDLMRTSAGGGRMATSVGGPATGFGCDYLIVDDMTKASASSAERLKAIDMFQTTLLSRLNDKKTGVVIVVAQRTHTDDLPGFLLTQPGWTHLNLQAIAPTDTSVAIGESTIYQRKKGEVLHPAREDLATLEELRKSIGDATFAAQYLQAPGAPQGAVFPPRWFARYETAYPLRRYDNRVFVIDTAFTPATTSDYSVCSVFGVWGENSDLLDVWRDRVDFDGLLTNITEMMDKYKPSHVFIEASANGRPLYDVLHKRFERGLHLITPQISKEDRAARVQPYLQQRKIRLPRKAPWLAVWEAEIFSFPSTMYDDQVDTLVYFASYAPKGFRIKASIEWFSRPPPGRLFSYF